jgi:sorbose reductase
MSTPTLLSHPDPSSPVLSHFSLLGKTAIVTGGTRGIGLEISRGLAEAGASVAILYTSTNPSTADDIAASISKSTGQLVKAYKADVTSAAELGDTISAITLDLFKGHLDIVVANAGIATHYAAEDYTPEQFQEIMNVNLNGAFYTAQAGGRIFKEQFSRTGKQGRVIFTASVSASLVNVPQKQSAYNASKAAVVQLARCLSVEWVGFARVNCISPVCIADKAMKEKANCTSGIHSYR